MSSRKRGGEQDPFWWQQLGPDHKELPPSVEQRLKWYEKEVGQHRVRFYLLETLIIVFSAAIPAAAAAGASTVTVGILGALVTALVGVRQLFRLGESWIRLSGTLIALQQEVVAWSVGAEPYNHPQRADAELSVQVESLVVTETSQWRALRRAALPGKANTEGGLQGAPG